MREIIFRGKRIDNGEWIQGYLSSYRTISIVTGCEKWEEIAIDPSTI